MTAPTCAAPGCTNPPRERRDPRARRPRYCDDHNNSTAWSRAMRERQQAERKTVTAFIRSAERRRCPKCGRGSALIREEGVTLCRWAKVHPPKCDYSKQETTKRAEREKETA